MAIVHLSVYVWPAVPVNPEVALCNAIAVCEGLASARQVRVERLRATGVTGVTGAILVMADTDRLSQVFINLISNAIRHNTSAAPFVRILPSA